jgi:ABC-2 type transport system permease protein
VGLYTMVAWRSLRRHATYRAASAAGAFTNTIFGFIRAYILIALWTQRPQIGGYDVTAAVTFCFLGQSLIAAVGAFLPTVSAELSERIRNGDIAIDLFRPADFQGWWLSHELGRAVHALVFRGLPPLLIGAFFFEFTWPSGWRIVAVALSVALAIVVSFGIRYLVTLTAFWLLDDAGPSSIAMLAGTFLSGLLIPLVLLPGWLGTVARSTPWAATIQSPSDIWLGVYGGAGVLAVLGLQALWALVLLLTGRRLTERARRRVVVQGG